MGNERTWPCIYPAYIEDGASRVYISMMEWTQEGLDELVLDLRDRGGDLTDVEVKAAAGGCPSLGETLSAFGNMPDGGTIILGLDESDRFRAVGLSDLATLEQGVVSQARDAVTPPLHCSFRTLAVDGCDVLVCRVDGLPLAARPARYGSRAYLRQSDGDYPMSEQEIAQLAVMQAQGINRRHYDAEPVAGASAEDFAPELLESYIARVRSSSRRLREVTDRELLTRTNVTTVEGLPTLAGIYALGAYPQQFLPELSITAAVHLPRSSGARTRDLVHLSGPLPDLLEDAMAWVERNTLTVMGYDRRGHGTDRPELPMNAVREVIANALIHRDLSPAAETKKVEIRLTGDRLVVTSPGGLWGVAEAQLGQPDGKSAVNARLYEICKHVRLPDGSRLIEGEGGGIREAMVAMREAGLEAPRFHDAGVRFTVLLPRHSLLSSEDIAWLDEHTQGCTLTAAQRAILTSMRHGTEWTNSLVRERFAPLDSVEARALLQSLVEQGLARKEGERGSALYLLADDAAEEPGTSTSGVGLEGVGGVTRHAETIWGALSEPRTLAELVEATGLTRRQVEHTLRKLRAADYARLSGGPGQRPSVYMRSDGSGSGTRA